MKKYLFFVICFFMLSFNVKAFEMPNNPYTISADYMYEVDGITYVYSNVKISAPVGYKISADNSAFEDVINIADNNDIPYEIYLKEEASGDISDAIVVEETIRVDKFIKFGKPKSNNDIISYVNEDGVTYARIASDEIIWAKETVNGKDFWVGLDNSNNVLEENSGFNINFYDEQNNKRERDYALGLIDSSYKEKMDINNALLLDINAFDSQEIKYTRLDSNIKLYVELPNSFDEEIKSLFISENNDEEIETEVVTLTTPDGSTRFASISLNHFSPYIIYNDMAENPKTSDNIVVSVIMLIMSLGSILIIKRKVRA